MAHPPFFWLHVKKSAGMTIRSLLHPYYVQVDRTKKPKTFIQAAPEEYNDILNNYRVVLGEYQFKRCLFARTYLYPQTWKSIYSFAFVREPADRCVSMFYYLFWQNGDLLQKASRIVARSIAHRKLVCSTSFAFDVFLDCVVEARASDSIFRPLGLHFTTHTAPMHDDVTDHEGAMLLRRVHRLDALARGLNAAFEECGVSRKVEENDVFLNRTGGRADYRPSTAQMHKIRRIYAGDFELYEAAEH